MPEKKPLRVGYVSGPECYPLVLADRLGIAARHGVELELVECLGLSSLAQKMTRGTIDVAIRDSVEAFLYRSSKSDSDLVAGALIRGARNHVMVSGRLKRMGGVDIQSLGLLIRNKSIEKPLRIAVAEPVGSTECYRMEFARSAGQGWTQRVVLPSEVMEESLTSDMIDGYCCGLQVTEGLAVEKTGAILSGLKAVPSRRESALVARQEFLMQERPSYLALLAAMLEAQQILSVPSRLTANVNMIPAENEYGEETVRAAITDVYLTHKGRAGQDPGVLGTVMSGGVVRPSPQWELVTSKRCRRLGMSREMSAEDSFLDLKLYDEALALLAH